jgi:hypothetical protein
MSDPPLTNVSRAVRYREIAENCRTWAKEARNEAERKDFLDMARIGAHANAEFDKGPTEGGLIRSSPVVSASKNALWAVRGRRRDHRGTAIGAIQT